MIELLNNIINGSMTNLIFNFFGLSMIAKYVIYIEPSIRSIIYIYKVLNKFYKLNKKERSQEALYNIMLEESKR